MNTSISRHLHRTILAFCLAIMPFAPHSFSQTDTPAPPSPNTPCKPPATPTTPPAKPCPAKHHTDTSISIGTFSQLTIDRTQDFPNSFFTAQGTAPSAGTLGTFRQTFSSWLGYSVNLGYARVSEHYRENSGIYYSPDGFNVDSNVYESSITYIAHTSVNKRFSLFGDVGPGLQTFLPVHRGPDAINYVPGGFAFLIPSVQVRPTGVFGSGIDVHLTRRFDLRAEYRGLFYKNPDFQTGDAPYSKQFTLTNEPTVSLVYHLHNYKP